MDNKLIKLPITLAKDNVTEDIICESKKDIIELPTELAVENTTKCIPEKISKEIATEPICINLDDTDDDVVILNETPKVLKRKREADDDCSVEKKLKLSDSVIIIDDEVQPIAAAQSYRKKLRRKLLPKVHTKDMACSPIVIATRKTRFSSITKSPIKQNMCISAAATSTMNNEVIPSKNIPSTVNVPSNVEKNPYALMQDYLKTMMSIVSNNIGELPPIPEASSNNNRVETVTSTTVSASAASESKPSMIVEARNINNNVPCENLYQNCGQFISDNIHLDTLYKMEGLRPIVIDGSNIAMTYTLGKSFSVKGLKICIDFFLKRGHKVYAFIPSFRLLSHQSDDQKLLQKLVKDELVFCTASRFLSNGRRICSYDDRILLQAAGAMNAVIVSQDRFRDVAKESYQLQRLIDNNLLIPTWCRGMIIFPADPFGKDQICLDDFLRFP